MISREEMNEEMMDQVNGGGRSINANKPGKTSIFYVPVQEKDVTAKVMADGMHVSSGEF